MSGLGRPDLCGGIGVLAAALDSWRVRLDLHKLLRYARYQRNRTAARRLGFLLERLGILNPAAQFRLRLWVGKAYGRLEPGRPWQGNLEPKWRLDLND